MNKFFISIVLLTLFTRPTILFCQEIARNYQMQPITIDTINEKIIVVHKRNANVFFRQSDIQEYVNDSKFGLPNSESYIITNAILKSNKKRIDLNDQSIDFTDEEIRTNPSSRKELGFDQIAMPEISYIGAHLIMSEKFMVYENQTGKLILERLNIIILDSGYGSKCVQFKFPSGLSFWRKIIFLGD